MGTNTQDHPLAVGTADELASMARKALGTASEAGRKRATFTYKHGTAEEADAMRRDMRAASELDDTTTTAFWSAFYLYAGAVGDLRDALRQLVEDYADRDADELDGRDALELWERLEQIAGTTFGTRQ